MIHTIRFWIWNARSRALPQSLLPASLAFCMALQTEGFSVFLGTLAVLGVIAGHLSMNLFDDYFDYKVKKPEYRDALTQKGFRARMAKCAYITSGKADLKQLLVACFAFGAVALSAGAVIFLYRGTMILWLALITAGLGISYSGAPLRLSYHGMGEVIIGLVFGPLLMAGVYYSASGRLSWPVAFVSVPVGLLVANIVYTHSIMDYEPDREVGKMTFAVLLKSKKRMLAGLLVLLAMAYASIICGVITRYLSHWYLLTLLTLPMAIALLYLMKEFIRHPEKRFSPQIWMGPMGNWQRMQDMDLDWFMIRWLLARNLLSFFCLLIILSSFLSNRI
jgi:1,4-dihydroxy-2-naphthoate octaprenyltransferase